MSKRYIDCAEILCLSKYNMYLEINLYYQCTIISIIFFHYINESTTVFLGKKNKNKNLLEFLFLKQVWDHLFVVTFIVQITLCIFDKWRKLWVNCFIEIINLYVCMCIQVFILFNHKFSSQKWLLPNNTCFVLLS